MYNFTMWFELLVERITGHMSELLTHPHYDNIGSMGVKDPGRLALSALGVCIYKVIIAA